MWESRSPPFLAYWTASFDKILAVLFFMPVSGEVTVGLVPHSCILMGIVTHGNGNTLETSIVIYYLFILSIIHIPDNYT